MKVLLFGASGMVGAGVLIECIEDPRVESVLVIGRSPCGVAHPKVRELLRKDFFDFTDAKPSLAGFDACFYSIGVTSLGKTEAEYTRLTYDVTMAAAKPICELNPSLTFCFVSGEHTDEHSSRMWARVKGKTESELFRMPFKAYAFRPGYIQPMKGVKSKTNWYSAFYAVFGFLYPLTRRLLPTHVTSTENVGRAMIRVALNGYSKRVLENADINAVATAP
jgi:uncharacterized protein YbjT (DUF2867 family)